MSRLFVFYILIYIYFVEEFIFLVNNSYLMDRWTNRLRYTRSHAKRSCLTPAKKASRARDFRGLLSWCYCNYFNFFSPHNKKNRWSDCWFCLCLWQRQINLYDSFCCLVVKENLLPWKNYYLKKKLSLEKMNWNMKKISLLRKKNLLLHL